MAVSYSTYIFPICANSVKEILGLSNFYAKIQQNFRISKFLGGYFSKKKMHTETALATKSSQLAILFAIIQKLSYLCSRLTNFNTIMPQMIMLGSEMLRINPAKKTVEYSTSQGRSWSSRYSSSSCGEFIDLLPYENELLAVTSKGVYYSTSQGRSWSSRYTSSSCGEFQCLMDGGRELLAQTSKGLYYSTSGGRSWSKRR